MVLAPLAPQTSHEHQRRYWNGRSRPICRRRHVSRWQPCWCHKLRLYAAHCVRRTKKPLGPASPDCVAKMRSNTGESFPLETSTPGASGETIVSALSSATPPGGFNRAGTIPTRTRFGGCRGTWGLSYEDHRLGRNHLHSPRRLHLRRPCPADRGRDRGVVCLAFNFPPPEVSCI
jgi:hypothetical protein